MTAARSAKAGKVLALSLESATGSVVYSTKRGQVIQGLAEDVLKSAAFKQLRGRVQMIFTSPPFPLNRKKRYGNLQGDEYVAWLAAFAPLFRQLLTKDGSIVMELGNAWLQGSPVMSPLALKALLAFLENGHLHLCQQFICHNPARLPSPVQWVNVKRIRVKDAYTHVWWMSPTAYPKADNRRILKPYSAAMLKLLKQQRYNSGRRPSQHSVGKVSFLRDNKGAIPSNVITLSNTNSVEGYLQHCRAMGLHPHEARMPIGLPEFFIKFLTTPRNLVLDPFAGSNTTGAAAEHLKRRWISIEPNPEYITGSRGRFSSEDDLR